MKLFCLLAITLVSVGSYATTSKKNQRQPSSLPPICMAVVETVESAEAAGDQCAQAADQLHKQILLQMGMGQISQEEVRNAFETETKMRQISNAYYLKAMKQAAKKVGVG